MLDSAGAGASFPPVSWAGVLAWWWNSCPAGLSEERAVALLESERQAPPHCDFTTADLSDPASESSAITTVFSVAFIIFKHCSARVLHVSFLRNTLLFLLAQ